MRKIFANSVVMVLMLLLFSCEYDNNSTVYNEVTPFSGTIKATISFTNYKLKDTVFLSKKDSLAYNIAINTGRLDSTSFQMNGIALKTKNNYVKIDTILTKNTKYPLKIFVHVGTNSGSLADIKWVEGLTIKDSTVLYVKFI